MLLGNGVDGLAGGKVATNVQFVKNTIPETSNKAKSSKTKCCCSVAQLCLTLSAEIIRLSGLTIKLKVSAAITSGESVYR